MRLMCGKESEMEHNEHIMWTRRRGYLSRSMRLGLLLSGLFLLGVVSALFAYTMVKRNALDRLVCYEQELTQEVVQLDVLNSQKKQLETESQQLDIRFAKIQKVTCTNKNNPYPYLHSIEKFIPDHVVLTLFAFDRKTIRLEGLANKVQEVTKFMRLLSKSKLVKSPQLATLDRSKKNSQVRFVINVTNT